MKKERSVSGLSVSVKWRWARVRYATSVSGTVRERTLPGVSVGSWSFTGNTWTTTVWNGTGSEDVTTGSGQWAIHRDFVGSIPNKWLYAEVTFQPITLQNPIEIGVRIWNQKGIGFSSVTLKNL